jgi:hypothetical protein
MRVPIRWPWIAVAASWLLAAGCGAATPCLAIDAAPDGVRLATIALGGPPAFFVVTYVHSVTRTPVDETYRVDGDRLEQTGIAFSEHGPGLPTAPDPGQTWSDVDGRFRVTLARHFDTIRMRVHRDQSPRLTAAGRAIDLAQWGNRAIALHVASCGASTR